jgi:predicted lipoprotein
MRLVARRRRGGPARVLTAVAVAAVLAGGARADGAAPDAARETAYRQLNEALVEHHVVPRYARLAEAAATLDEAARRLCAMPATMSIDAIRAAFHATADAWHDVEHLRFGPMESRLRAERLVFWPDPRNATGRQLAGLLAGRDPAALTAAGFLRSSAAVQGLPAVERLLFDDGAVVAFSSDSDEARRRCQVLAAITRNVTTITAEVRHEWFAGDLAYARRIATAGPGNATYPAPKEATLDFLKSFHGGLERIARLKLAKPLGASPDTARPTLAEEWRSGRALRNVQRNLAALRALYLGESATGMSDVVRNVAGAPDLDARLRRGLDASIDAADRIPGSLEMAVASPSGRAAVERLLNEVQTVTHAVAEHLTTALDLPLGFNALDGD